MLPVQNLKTFPQISCILAIDEENGIGKSGKIPWNIPSDIKYFQSVTESYCTHEGVNVVIMGKNTWESISAKHKPLSDRVNIVVSTSYEKNYNDISDLILHGLPYGVSKEIIVNNVTSAFDAVQQLQKHMNIDNVFIIGGKRLYDMVFDNPNMITGQLHVTRIKGKFDTDTKVNFNEYFFDEIRKQELPCGNGNISIYKPKENLEEMSYLKILNKIITMGDFRPTRNANTRSCFATSLTFDLNKSFPLLTTKKMFLRGIFEELKFFLLGQTDTKILEQKKVNIWKGNTTRQFLDSVGLHHLQEGDMGPLYGFQLRHYGGEYHGCNYDHSGCGYDQFANVLNLLKTDKYSRRIMMTTFNPAQISQGPLPPCHGIVIQFGVENGNKLSCHMYQRSADFFLGVPFNIASYGLLVHIICELINNDLSYSGEKFVPGMLTMSFGDYHVYEQHIEVVKEQIERIPYSFPQVTINKKITKIEDLNFEDISVINYKSHESLKADMIA